MTLDEQLHLREGDYLRTTRWSMDVPKDPVRVTKVWVNAERTIVRVRLFSVYGPAWVSPEGWERAVRPKAIPKSAKGVRPQEEHARGR